MISQPFINKIPKICFFKLLSKILKWILFGNQTTYSRYIYKRALIRVCYDRNVKQLLEAV